MSKAFTNFIFSFVFAQTLWAQYPGGEEILKKIDRNLVFENAISITTMIIHSRSGTRSIQSKNWISGRDKAFVEYLQPPRERGKKMLKLAKQIWNYLPEPTDRILSISGHLLRQSVMGSDLSYEDMLENNALYDLYSAVVVGTEELQKRRCYKLELTAKKEDIAYFTRVLWVDAEHWLPLREERFAKSGRVLKRTEILETFRVDTRWYPRRVLFKDMLQQGEGTEYIIEELDLNTKIPDTRFSKAALKK